VIILAPASNAEEMSSSHLSLTFMAIVPKQQLVGAGRTAVLWAAFHSRSNEDEIERNPISIQLLNEQKVVERSRTIMSLSLAFDILANHLDIGFRLTRPSRCGQKAYSNWLSRRPSWPRFEIQLV